MTAFHCSSCGREMAAAPECPHCGAEQGQWAEELARIERSIAELKARDAELLREQKTLAVKMQAAIFQRDILAHANQEQLKRRGSRPRRVLRRWPGGRAPTVSPGAPSRIPRQPSFRRGDGHPPPPEDRRPGPARPSAPPETSSRQTQNVLLGLGALLLAVTATVFAAVADDVTRIAMLTTATALMLGVPPLLARRGLTSTAETVTAVGLVLVALDGYALWTVDPVREGPLSATVFAGLTFLITTAVAAGYGMATGLDVPRYATVLAAQPVLPLLVYNWVAGLAGWALVLTAVAALDLLVGRQLTRPGGLPWPPGLADRLRSGRPAARPAPPDEPVERPESAAEEPDAVLVTDSVHPRSGGPQAAWATDDDRTADVTDADVMPDVSTRRSQPSAMWLHKVTWFLHGLTVVAALLCATVALITAGTVPAASRAGAMLLLAAGIGLAGARTVNQPPLPDFAAGVLTLTVVAAVSRVAAVALPGRALLLIAAVIALTGVGVRAVPASARLGPQLASAVTLVVIGVLVAGSTVRAALAPIRAALPAWDADLVGYSDQLAEAVGPAGWQLVATAFLLTVAAVLALPPELRREFAVCGAALTALAVPASLGLPWWAAPWPGVLAAVGIGVVGLSARTERATHAHVIAAAVVGLAAGGASAARPGLTAAVLAALVVAGVLITVAATVNAAYNGAAGEIVAAWAAGGTAFALPGAVAALVRTTVHLDPLPTPAELQTATAPVLAACFLAVGLTLGYAALSQLSRRRFHLPVSVGAGLGAVAVAIAAFVAPGATEADAWIGTLVVVGAVLLFLTPSIDLGRSAGWPFTGPDLAAAAAATVLVAALARIAAILVPHAELVASAGLVLLVVVAVRLMPEHWRYGPVTGVAVSGGVLALISGVNALRGGLQALTTPGRLWQADLDAWPIGAGIGWQIPLSLVLLAAAAAILLPRPWAYDVAGLFVGLATIGTPAAFGLPWWSPIVVGCTVAAGYALMAVAAADPRAGLARAVVAVAVALHAVGTSLVRPWTTAAALAVVALIGCLVAILAGAAAALAEPQVTDHSETTVDADPMPPHLALIGGTTVAVALLALPGAVAATAVQFGWPVQITLTGALAASTLGLAVVALTRARVPHYLPYATVGVTVGATVTALAALPTDLPAGVYAAAAVLLGVLSELLRAVTPAPGATIPVHHWSVTLAGVLRRPPVDPRGGWSVSPVMGALAAAALPTALAVATLAPALLAALVAPHQTLRQIWAGPPAALTTPPAEAVAASNVVAALLLTVAAALAATGFTGRGSLHAIPVILPGAAITLLIAPISLDLPWPAGTLAALGVFTISMLGLALTPPPRELDRTRPIRVARVLVFIIGLAGGGAGLAGSLATPQLTLVTLGGAVAVGALAALAGRTQHARILGWLFATVAAHGFVLTVGLRLHIAPAWSAFGVLAAGAALLVLASTLPRLRRPEALRETATVEWSGYGSALIAVALAYDSPRHVGALLAAWGAVLGVAALRPGRSLAQWRILFWAAAGCEIAAWSLMMYVSDVALPEAYTLPFAALALVVGLLELHRRPELTSWVAYGPALVAALLPTLVIVVATDTSYLRQIFLLLGAVATLIFGTLRQQQAPVVIGGVVTALAALHALTLVGPWLVLLPVGLTLLALGANSERRRRTQERLKALREMQ